MYHLAKMQSLISFVTERDGIADKAALAKQVQAQFSLTKVRSVYYCDDFAIRFCTSARRSFGNTVLALSALQRYDRAPFVVCLVMPDRNALMLANTTFLRKISHSSQELRTDNIRGSFNGSDIMRDFAGRSNEPDNFAFLFAAHEKHTFSENLERLVEATNGIQPTGGRVLLSARQISCIMRSVERTQDFLQSDCCAALRRDLEARVCAVESEIVKAAEIDNVNIRGRSMEYLLTSDGEPRNDLLDALRAGSSLPKIYTADGLGDYSCEFDDFHVEVDIKTKMLFLSSTPKGYNIDKLLAFLAEEKSVYLIYVVAVDEDRHISTRLCSPYHRQILERTRIMKHWAGRNSRGVTQYDGHALESAVFDFDDSIDAIAAKEFLKRCLDL